MLLSFPIALLDYLRGVKITEEEVQKRRDICAGCEFKKKIKKIDYCKQCTCVLEGDLGKLHAPREYCPIKKW